jgi:hypothetical protein
MNGCTDDLYTPLGTTSNYSATASLHNSQITTAPAKSLPVFCVFTSRSLAKVSNSGDFLALRAQVLSSEPPMQNSTELIAPTVMVITSRERLLRKHRYSTVACVYTAGVT